MFYYLHSLEVIAGENSWKIFFINLSEVDCGLAVEELVIFIVLKLNL